MKHRILTAFSVLSLALALPACASPARPRTANDADPALWVVKDRDTTVYLFGTIHVLKPRLTWFDEAVRTAFDRSDEVKLEIVAPDPAAMRGLVTTKGLSANSPTLTEQLPAKERPALAKAMATIGVPAAAYDHMRPWLATSYLEVQTLGQFGYDPSNGPEQIITAAARSANKPVSGLETVEQQIGWFSDLSQPTQVQMLSSTLDELPTLKATIGTMVDEWAHGRTDGIARELNKGLTESPEAMRVLLTDRNARWADWIKARLTRPGTVFIAVGAGHLAGPQSVQAMLARRGVKVTRVKY